MQHTALRTHAGGLATEQGWLLLIAAYFFCNQLLRVWVSGTADLDQSEQLVLAQSFAWGYGAQPPLYTWIVRGLFGLTGVEHSVLLLFKALLLTAIFAVLLAIGRMLSFSASQHVIMLCSAMLLPQLIWESQRDLTHSTLAALMGLLLFWQVLRTLQAPQFYNYLLAGVLAGLGLLSKYNLVFFPAALGFALLSMPVYRPFVLNRNTLFALMVMVAMLLPHLAWVQAHPDLAAGSLHKLQVTNVGVGAGLGTGVAQAWVSALAFLSPLWLFALCLWPRKGASLQPALLPARILLMRTLIGVMVLVSLFVLISGAQEIKDRWYQPLLCLVPVAVAAFSRPTRLGYRMFVGLALLVVLLVGVMLNQRIVQAERMGKLERPNIPLVTALEQLRVQGLSQVLPQGPAQDVAQILAPQWIVADSTLLAGNARQVFPEALVVTPDYRPALNLQQGQGLVLCASARCDLPSGFAAYLQQQKIDWQGQTLQIKETPYYFSTQSYPLYWLSVSRPVAD